jgi:HD superfamily phosphohydrolase
METLDLYTISAIFGLGILAGLLLFMAIAYIIFKKEEAKFDELNQLMEKFEQKKLDPDVKKATDEVNRILDEMINRVSNVDTIKKRAEAKFNEALKISDEQQELMARLDGPSKGAAFSRWRNDVREELMDLERKKIDLFKEILADGIDPYITVKYKDDSSVKIRMSEAVQKFEELDKPAFPKNKKKPEPTKPKFRVITNDTEEL